MKSLLTAAVASFALITGAQAADYIVNKTGPVLYMPSGDLSLYAGGLELSCASYGSSCRTNGTAFGGLGRANVWLAPKVSGQLDFGAENDWESKYSSNYSVVDLAGHVSYRPAPGELLGGFVSAGYYGWYGSRLATIGLEGQTTVGPVLLYGQAGYTGTMSSSGYNGNLNAYYIQGEARYFIRPDLMLAGNVGYARAKEVQESEPHDLWRWGLDLEWRAPKSWWGAFVSYQGAHDHETTYSADDFTTNAVFVGLKIYFDKGTLQSQSESGATLRDFNPYTGTDHVRFFDWN